MLVGGTHVGTLANYDLLLVRLLNATSRVNGLCCMVTMVNRRNLLRIHHVFFELSSPAKLAISFVFVLLVMMMLFATARAMCCRIVVIL